MKMVAMQMEVNKVYPIRGAGVYFIFIYPAMSREVRYTSWKTLLVPLRIPQFDIPAN